MIVGHHGQAQLAMPVTLYILSSVSSGFTQRAQKKPPHGAMRRLAGFEMGKELRYAVSLEPGYGALEAVFCRVLTVARAVVSVEGVWGVGVHHKL